MKQRVLIHFKHSAASCDKHYLPTPVTADLCWEHPPLPCCTTAGKTWNLLSGSLFISRINLKKKKFKNGLSLLLCLAEQLSGGSCQ